MGILLLYLLYEIRSELHITRPSPKALTQTILSASDVYFTNCDFFTDIYKSQVTTMKYDYAGAEKMQQKIFELMIIITPIR